MFGVPGESFIDNWLSFIVFAVILVTVVLIGSKIAKTKKGMHTGNFLSKFLLAITYPFHKIRSKLSQRGQSAFDGFFYLLYCAGAIWLIMYAAS